MCQVLLARRPASSSSARKGRTQAGLLLGSIGLLYSHYLGALLLPVLGLFHLLFVAEKSALVASGAPVRTRHYWLPPCSSRFCTRGVAYTEVEELGRRVLTAPALLSRLIRFLTNGLVVPSPPFSELLLLALPLVLVIVFLRKLRRGKGFNSVWLLVFTSDTLLALVIVINEVFRVIVDNRIRYLMPLWPLTALLVGAGLWRLAGRYQRLVAGLLALWLVLGAWLIVATDFHYELGYFLRKENRQLFPVVRENVPASDLLAFDYTPALVQSGWFYDRKSTFKNIYRYKADPYETIRPVPCQLPLPVASIPLKGPGGLRRFAARAGTCVL